MVYKRVYSSLDPTGGGNALMLGRAASWKMVTVGDITAAADRWFHVQMVRG